MSIDVAERTKAVYCEGACGQIATPERPVLRWATSSNLDAMYRCKDCLYESMRTNPDSIVAEGKTCACGDEAFYCSPGCAINDGHEYQSSCSNCGDEAYYCSADCAIRSGSEVYCHECGENNTVVCTTADCGESVQITSAAPEGATITTVAASSVVEADEASVTVGDIEFRF